MSEEVLSLPLENPFEIPENSVIDLSLTKFSDDFVENINTAFIYLRNIEYSGRIDFSKFSKDQLFQIIKSYMLRDIKDFNIKDIDYTLFCIMIPSLFEEDNIHCLLSKEQLIEFVNNNIDLCKELYQLLISLPIYIMSLDKSNTFSFDITDVKHIEDMPLTYECMLQLLKYEYADLLMFLPEELKPFDVDVAIFDKVFKYDNAALADKVVNSTYSNLYSDLVDSLVDGLSSTVLSSQ